MKTTQLGKKLERNVIVNLIALAVGAISFFVEYPHHDAVFSICAVAVFLTLVRVIIILDEGSFRRYGFFGLFEGPNPFYTLEPGDPGYEEEMKRQGRSDDDEDEE